MHLASQRLPKTERLRQRLRLERRVDRAVPARGAHALTTPAAFAEVLQRVRDVARLVEHVLCDVRARHTARAPCFANAREIHVSVDRVPVVEEVLWLGKPLNGKGEHFLAKVHLDEHIVTQFITQQL